MYKYLDPSVDYNCLFKDTAKNEEEILQASRVQRFMQLHGCITTGKESYTRPQTPTQKYKITVVLVGTIVGFLA